MTFIRDTIMACIMFVVVIFAHMIGMEEGDGE
jgi:hypothetical protein